MNFWGKKLAQVMDKNDIDFGGPDPIFKSHEVEVYRKMVCLHPISWMDRWILTKLAQIYCWYMDKN